MKMKFHDATEKPLTQVGFELTPSGKPNSSFSVDVRNFLFVFVLLESLNLSCTKKYLKVNFLNHKTYHNKDKI